MVSQSLHELDARWPHNAQSGSAFGGGVLVAATVANAVGAGEGVGGGEGVDGEEVRSGVLVDVSGSFLEEVPDAELLLSAFLLFFFSIAGIGTASRLIGVGAETSYDPATWRVEGVEQL